MQTLPSELIQQIFQILSFVDIWKIKRVSKAWANAADDAFLLKLLKSKTQILSLNLFIVNSRGGPWFSQLNYENSKSSAIEDRISIPLFVESISNQIITFKPPKSQILLQRRSCLDRFEWCLKGAFKHTDNLEPIPKSDTFTLVSIDTLLNSGQNEMSISTFEMQLFYNISDKLVNANISEIEFQIKDLRASYSFFINFIKKKTLDNNKSHARISVFDNLKIKNLLSTAKEWGIPWHDKYWTFDVVLHWLLEGDTDDIPSIMEFLIEHEKISTRNQAIKTRYYALGTKEC